MLFERILFVSTGLQNDTTALLSAMELAKRSQSDLDVSLVLPMLPQNLVDYVPKFVGSVVSKFTDFIDSVKTQSGFTGTMHVSILHQKHPFVGIIKLVLQHHYDVVIKQVDSANHEKGFKALDMNLLRKCPCPVMLCRPGHEIHNASVAVAIDPLSEDQSGHALSVNLLRTALELTSGVDKPLDVLSCWDFSLENSLTTGTWLSLSVDELTDEKEKYRADHLKALHQVLKEVEEHERCNVQHINGFATIQIPQYIADQEIDLLVMGTVGRAGLEGFIFGNTAENILQSLQCSLLALKPEGFSCPVTL